MSDRLTEGLSGDDAAIFSTNSTNGNFYDSNDTETEDPTGIGSRIRNTIFPSYGGRRIKSGATPSGHIPNKTPGAKCVQW